MNGYSWNIERSLSRGLPLSLTRISAGGCLSASAVPVNGSALPGTKISVRNINNLRYAVDTTLTAESEDELNSLLMKVKEKSEKAGFKLSIKQTKMIASGPITS